VYVQEGIYEKFIAGYKKAMEDKRNVVGDPDKSETAIGPLVDEAQFKRVSGFIERGQQGQGKLLVGGQRIGDKGWFIEPTVFTDVDVDSEIHTQEIFGPVSVVRSFKTEEEIMHLSNNTNFGESPYARTFAVVVANTILSGLMAGVFTQDINKALRVASEFDSGMVGVNCVSLMFMNTPFGGSKESGLGRECGRDALRAFTELKTIMVNLSY